MWERSALFPQIALLRWYIHDASVLVSVQKLPKMVVWVAQAHSLTRLTDVVYVEVGEPWAHNCHADHGAECRRDDRNVEDERKLADLVAKLDHERVAVRDQVMV